MARLTMTLLGAPLIQVDGAPIEVDTRKAVALLAWLALSGGHHSRDTLAALLWPETDHARAALRRTLSTLRGALGERWLAIDRESIAFVPGDDVWIDVAAFQELAVASDIPALERAVDLYRGDFMAGFSLRDSPEFDDWVTLQAESLRRELAGALETLAQAHCARQQFEPAVRFARRWVALDPVHEEAQRWLMQALAWSGDRSAALRQYRACVRVLDAELGVAPLDETTALYQELLEHRDPPLPQQPALETVTRQPSTSAREIDHTPPGQFPLVGRDEALATLAGAWRSCGTQGRLAVVHGEAGIGKTRLAETLLALAGAEGAAITSARCYEGESNLAYGPFIEGLRGSLARAAEPRVLLDGLPDYVLADVSRLLPEIAAPRDELPLRGTLDGPGAMARFFGSVLALLDAALAGDAPGILFIDDVQWLDAASLDLLGFITRRLDRRRFLLLIAWRDEQVDSDHRLRHIQAEAARSGLATSLPLTLLSPAEARDLIERATGDSDSGALSERLFAETAGLPFFLTEYLREALQRPTGAAGGDVWPLPGGVRDMLRQRLSAVPALESQLLTALATAGRACSFDLLREASGRSVEEVVGAIEGSLARGLVVEQPSPTAEAGEPLYAFSHEKLREMVYADTLLARRRLVHRRIADALRASVPGGASAQVAPQAAVHYRLAGADAEAAEQYRIAGDAARDLHASDDALAQYRLALALGHPDAAGLHAAIGEQSTLLGRYDAAFDSYEAAAALSDAARLGEIEWKLGALNQRLGRWERAERHFEAATTALAATEDGGRDGDLSRVYADWSLAAHRRGDLPQARQHARRSLDLAQHAGDARALAQAHNLLGILARASGDLPEARAAFEESLR
ncbi:MAG TPA: AAA family ATPase, partial [Thermomicrobiales bacterium]|nr:AAA family ATPase [Thermomicrobiales bacterium]